MSGTKPSGKADQKMNRKHIAERAGRSDAELSPAEHRRHAREHREALGRGQGNPDYHRSRMKKHEKAEAKAAKKAAK